MIERAAGHFSKPIFRSTASKRASTPSLPSLSARDWTLPWNLGFEITQPRPERALVQIHFGDADGAPYPGLGEHAAVLTIDGGEHPVARHVFVRAADEIDLVLTRAGARLLG